MTLPQTHEIQMLWIRDTSMFTNGRGVTLVTETANLQESIVSNFDTLAPEPGDNWFSWPNRLRMNVILPLLPQNPRVLEIGSWLGRSAAYMHEKRPDIQLTCLDTWKGSEEHAEGKTENLLERFQANMKACGILDKITMIVDDSKNLLNYFSSEELDMIYIDGSHQTEDVKQDFLAAYQIVKIQGHIVGDDWGWNAVSRGAMEAVWEINEKEEKVLPLNTHLTVYSTVKLK